MAVVFHLTMNIVSRSYTRWLIGAFICPILFPLLFLIQTQKLTNMGLFKLFMLGRSQNTIATRSEVNSVPHLVPKHRKCKADTKTTPISVDWTLLLVKSDNPAIPDIALRPATPPDGVLKVEDRLFERSGPVFVLHDLRSGHQSYTTSSPGGRSPSATFAAQDGGRS